MPDIAITSTEAADIGWVERDAEHVTVKLALRPSRHADRLRLAKQAGRRAAKRNDHARLGTSDVVQNGLAIVIDLRDGWTAIAWLPVFGIRDWSEWDGVRKAHLLGVDPGLVQHLTQCLAGRTDKWPALLGFLGTGCLADHIEPGSPETAFRRDATMIEMCVGDAGPGHRFLHQACKAMFRLNQLRPRRGFPKSDARSGWQSCVGTGAQRREF